MSPLEVCRSFHCSASFSTQNALLRIMNEHRWDNHKYHICFFRFARVAIPIPFWNLFYYNKHNLSKHTQGISITACVNTNVTSVAKNNGILHYLHYIGTWILLLSIHHHYKWHNKLIPLLEAPLAKSTNCVNCTCTCNCIWHTVCCWKQNNKCISETIRIWLFLSSFQKLYVLCRRYLNCVVNSNSVSKRKDKWKTWTTPLNQLVLFFTSFSQWMQWVTPLHSPFYSLCHFYFKRSIYYFLHDLCIICYSLAL